MTSSNWTEIEAMELVRPFGEDGADYRNGVLATAFGGGSPLDWMPVQRRINQANPATPPTAEQLAGKLAAAFGNIER